MGGKSQQSYLSNDGPSLCSWQDLPNVIVIFDSLPEVMGDEKSKVEKTALEMPHRAHAASISSSITASSGLNVLPKKWIGSLLQSWREDNIISILNIAFLLIAFSASQMYLYEMDIRVILMMMQDLKG